MNEAKTFRTKILKIASMKQKKPRFCFYKFTNAAENGSTQKNCSDMDLTGDLAGDIGAIFLYY
jgi:hypothetical protein